MVKKAMEGPDFATLLEMLRLGGMDEPFHPQLVLACASRDVRERLIRCFDLDPHQIPGGEEGHIFAISAIGIIEISPGEEASPWEWRNLPSHLSERLDVLSQFGFCISREWIREMLQLFADNGIRERYIGLSGVPTIAVALAASLSQRDDGEFYSTFAQICMSRFPLLPIQNKLLMYTGLNAESVAASIGMNLPHLSSEWKRVQWIATHADQYVNTFATMDTARAPLPNLKGAHDVAQILSRYDDAFLAKLCQTQCLSASRGRMIDRITKDAEHVGARLFIVLWPDDALNRDQVSTLTLERRTFSPQTIAVGFGSLQAFRIFEVEEIAASCREEGESSSFLVPDWTVESGAEYPRYFSPDQTRSLVQNIEECLECEREYLTQASRNMLASLRRRVISHLHVCDAQFRNVAALRNAFLRGELQLQQDTVEFLLGTLTLAMLTRGWMGPGYHWVYNAQDMAFRDPFIRSSRSSQFLTLLPKANALISAMHVRELNFETGEARFTDQTLPSLLNLVASGSYCIKLASNLLLSTSIFYLDMVAQIEDASIPLREYLSKDTLQEAILYPSREWIHTAIRANLSHFISHNDREVDEDLTPSNVSDLDQIVDSLASPPPLPLDKGKIDDFDATRIQSAYG